jgi:hypothetical protein
LLAPAEQQTVSPALFARDNIIDDFESIRHNEDSTEAPEAVVGRRRYARKCKNTINATILEAIGEGERNALRAVVNRNDAEAEDQIQSIGELIQHLLYSDDMTFDAALNALCVDLVKDPTKWEHVIAMGCSAVAPIVVWRVVKMMIR